MGRWQHLRFSNDGKSVFVSDEYGPYVYQFDRATAASLEYGYQLTTGSGVREITTLNDHEFTVDERDGKGLRDSSTAVVKTLFKIDLNGGRHHQPERRCGRGGLARARPGSSTWSRC
ncbi:MAG: esterase-like activity of phytase family protein [Burkholderiaceae bacterium]